MNSHERQPNRAPWTNFCCSESVKIFNKGYSIRRYILNYLFNTFSLRCSDLIRSCHWVPVKQFVSFDGSYMNQPGDWRKEVSQIFCPKWRPIDYWCYWQFPLFAYCFCVKLSLIHSHGNKLNTLITLFAWKRRFSLLSIFPSTNMNK